MLPKYTGILQINRKWGAFTLKTGIGRGRCQQSPVWGNAAPWAAKNSRHDKEQMPLAGLPRYLAG